MASAQERLDEAMIRRALLLAEKGRCSTSPNPMVGAVVARGRRVVGEGFHRRAGGPHAEIEALRAAGRLARGATLYVTLEPCVHLGRTGPCADAVIASGVSRVVASRKDPNPRVAGRGFRRLARSGIEVRAGVLAAEAARQNERFDVWVSRRRPFVLAKVAQTLDGRIADFRGRSRWISGPDARRLSMQWREEFDAILVGAGTIAADDPLLTRRLGLNRGVPHRRIILDGRLRVPEKARILRDPEGVEIWTAAGDGAKARRLAARGIRVLRWRGRSPGRVDLPRALRSLAREGVTGVLVEGGRETLTSFAQAGLIDRWAIFLSPMILGGRNGPGLLKGKDLPLSRARRLVDPEWTLVGGDMLITGRTEAQEGAG